jgi:hypothetical protein
VQQLQAQLGQVQQELLQARQEHGDEVAALKEQVASLKAFAGGCNAASASQPLLHLGMFACLCLVQQQHVAPVPPASKVNHTLHVPPLGGRQQGGV